MIELYFDGAITKNPGGTATAGAIIYRDREVIKEISEVVGSGEAMSCNVAEWAALLAGLQWIRAQNLQNEKITCYGDSQLVIRQCNKEARIGEGLYRLVAIVCKSVLKQFIDISFQWIPREENIEADRLSRVDPLTQEYQAVIA